MNLKKKFREFFTLTRKADGGFTLVELIVVIAILAILAGVAVPAYSGYVTRANKQADMSLASDVKQALALAYYANPDTFPQGIIALTPSAEPDCGDNAVLEAALEATFGEGWRNLRLKYDGWNAEFQGSNFYNDTEGLNDLLGTVEALTGALGTFLERTDIDDLLGTGGKFGEYMDGIGAGSADEKADAAVFYVADITSQYSAQDLQAAVNELMPDETGASPGATDALRDMNLHLNSSLASMAALYALAEGYASYCETKGNTYVDANGNTPRDILDAATAELATKADGTDSTFDTAAAFGTLMDAFQEMGGVGEGVPVADYMENYLAQDMNAYAEAMKMVAASKDSILENNGQKLGTENYFSSTFIQGILANYAKGGILVYALEKDGVMTITSSIDSAED